MGSAEIGVYAIEPFGDGSLREDKVNWANNDFGTSVSNNGLDFGGTRYNDGDLYDDEGIRTGNENWDPGDYLQINLGSVRELNQLVGVWDFVWAGTAFDISTSTDGTNFFPV